MPTGGFYALAYLDPSPNPQLPHPTPPHPTATPPHPTPPRTPFTLLDLISWTHKPDTICLSSWRDRSPHKHQGVFYTRLLRKSLSVGFKRKSTIHLAVVFPPKATPFERVTVVCCRGAFSKKPRCSPWQVKQNSTLFQVTFYITTASLGV